MRLNQLGNCKTPFQGKYKKVLCVCSAGLLRSPTAAVVLSQDPFNFNTRAVGISSEYALIHIDKTLLYWADEVVCMEDSHEDFVNKLLTEYGFTPKVINLNIPDVFEYREKELINQIKEKYSEY